MSHDLSIFKQLFSEPTRNYQCHFVAEKTEARTNKEVCPRHIATTFALKQQHLSDWGTKESVWMAKKGLNCDQGICQKFIKLSLNIKYSLQLKLWEYSLAETKCFLCWGSVSCSALCCRRLVQRECSVRRVKKVENGFCQLSYFFLPLEELSPLKLKN